MEPLLTTLTMDQFYIAPIVVAVSPSNPHVYLDDSCQGFIQDLLSHGEYEGGGVGVGEGVVPPPALQSTEAKAYYIKL